MCGNILVEDGAVVVHLYVNDLFGGGKEGYYPAFFAVCGGGKVEGFTVGVCLVCCGNSFFGGV